MPRLSRNPYKLSADQCQNLVRALAYAEERYAENPSTLPTQVAMGTEEVKGLRIDPLRDRGLVVKLERSDTADAAILTGAGVTEARRLRDEEGVEA